MFWCVYLFPISGSVVRHFLLSIPICHVFGKNSESQCQALVMYQFHCWSSQRCRCLRCPWSRESTSCAVDLCCCVAFGWVKTWKKNITKYSLTEYRLEDGRNSFSNNSDDLGFQIPGRTIPNYAPGASSEALGPTEGYANPWKPSQIRGATRLTRPSSWDTSGASATEVICGLNGNIFRCPTVLCDILSPETTFFWADSGVCENLGPVWKVNGLLLAGSLC